MFYVYILYRDVACTQPFYVGKGKGRRYKEHVNEAAKGRGTNKYKNNIVNKCVREFGYVPHTIEFKDLTEDLAFATERALITLYGRLNTGTGCLTNATDGGDGTSGHVRSSEVIATVAAKITGLKRTPEFCAAVRERQLGVKKSAEAVENNRLSHLGQRWTPEHRAMRQGQPMPWLHNAEVRAKISAALTGKKASEETRAKQSEAAKRRDPATRIREPTSLEVRAKISATKKAAAAENIDLARERFRVAQRARWAKREHASTAMGAGA